MQDSDLVTVVHEETGTRKQAARSAVSSLKGYKIAGADAKSDDSAVKDVSLDDIAVPRSRTKNAE